LQFKTVQFKTVPVQAVPVQTMPGDLAAYKSVTAITTSVRMTNATVIFDPVMKLL
jgi:hypothetical protein